MLSRVGIVSLACSPIMMERWYLRECVRSISVNGVTNGRLVHDAAFRPHLRDHRQCDIDGCLGISRAGGEQGRLLARQLHKLLGKRGASCRIQES